MAIKKKSFALVAVLIVYFIFIFTPLFSATEYTFKNGIKSHYSLANYRWVFSQPEFGHYILRSLWLSGLTIFISLLLLVPLQIWLHIDGARYRKVIDVLSLFPLIIPVVVYAIGAQVAMPMAMQDTVFELPFLYAMLALPYTYRTIDIGLGAIPLKTYSEAALSAGANWVKTIGIVILPAIRSAILAAIALCFALSIGEFTITSLLHWDTFPTWINDVSQGNVLGAITLSVISLVIPILILTLVAFVAPNGKRKATHE